MGNHGRIISSATRMQKRELGSDQIKNWLGLVVIPGVLFDGPVRHLAGAPPPKVDADACFESLEVKIEVSSSRRERFQSIIELLDL